MKGITKQKHWVTDYSYVPMVWAAPKLFDFEADEKATKIVRMFGAVVLTYSLLTDAKWGLVKVIPYKAHAALDLATGVAALTVPFVTDAAENKKVRNTLIGMGLVGITVGILSLIGAKKKKLFAL